VSEVDFRDRYGALVLGVIRDGRQLDEIQDVTLRPGDALLLVVREGMARAYADTKDFYLTGGHAAQEEAAMEVSLWRPTRAKAGVVILAAVVLLATTGILHISLAALGGAVAMTSLGFVTPAEARRSVDWSVLLVIGSAIGLGHALTASGAADLIAQGVVEVGAPLGPRGILGALVGGSMLLTLVITNNAAVAILFPVAVSVAATQGIDPRPLVVGVTISASLAFATPLGYQTNLMVYGPGGYRFSDYMRVGLPLQLLLGAVAVVLIPYVWGF
jgi:di/tricarboxylate transporter